MRLRHFLGPLLSLVFGGALFGANQGRRDDYQRAQAAVMNGAWDDAIAILHRAMEAGAEDLRTINLMGLALTGKGDAAGANEFFQKALQIDPKFYPARKNLAVNELNLKQLKEAERDFETVLLAVPSDAVANMYAGELAFARKDCKAAWERLRLAGPWLAKDAKLRVMMAECDSEMGHAAASSAGMQGITPEQLEPAWQFRVGYWLASHEKFAMAIPFFEAASPRFGANYDLNFDLALCYTRERRFANAIGRLEELRERGTRTSESDNLLAEAYEADGKTKQALDTLREATMLAPDEERNYMDLAILCADHKAYDLGLEVANIGLGHLPNSDALLVQRGVIHAMSGRFDLAESDFEHAGRSDAGRKSAAAGLGLSYIQQGETGRATDTLREGVRKDPANAALQYLLAESIIRSGADPGDPAFLEARAALERSVRLDARFVYSRIDLAKVYLREGDTGKAIEQLRAALAVDATKVQVYAQLGTALRKEGNTVEASAMFAKVRELNDFNRKHGEPAALVRGADTGAKSPL